MPEKPGDKLDRDQAERVIKAIEEVEKEEAEERSQDGSAAEPEG